MFKPSMSAEIQDWITPRQVEVVKVETLAEQFERIQQRADHGDPHAHLQRPLHHAPPEDRPIGE